MIEFLSKWRFSLLLLALVGNILLAPAFGDISSLIAFTVLLIVIVLVLGNSKPIIISYILLAFIALLFAWLHLANEEVHFITPAGPLFSFLALALAMAFIIKNIFTSSIVTIDTIASSLCAYLLLGFAFAHIYTLIDIIYPGSFLSSLTNEAVSFTSNKSGFLDKIYFSFITLLTVGYGDIVPASEAAKLTSIIEGFFGQIYLVVLIARLVGMHVSQRSHD